MTNEEPKKLADVFLELFLLILMWCFGCWFGYGEFSPSDHDPIINDVSGQVLIRAIGSLQ